MTSHSFEIRPERTADHPAVRQLHAQAFEDPERVPGLVDALRAAGRATSLVATDGGAVVGHVMLSPGRLDAPERLVDVLSLSPLGVHPEHQGRGVGTRLVAAALAAAEQVGCPAVFLEGAPAYYRARGFERADAVGFRRPSLRTPAPAFLVARLSAHRPWMTGTFVYAEPFWAHDCVGLRDLDLIARIESAD
ncbi:GNAT family N-acetyltransferase [Streptomyces sp. TLI_171]|uniref:GNAT family N-acetyltransferase n=1 Tax=Streptomyces sp. TLI_171 TaxID=1938859 RepID=UPI000C1752C2|nr:N-acetyltransferase [Streptomyces sp. TLI_171]RKE22484.1 putative acetyltransferase [Streptomyces sp. TLI_171]